MKLTKVRWMLAGLMAALGLMVVAGCATQPPVGRPSQIAPAAPAVVSEKRADAARLGTQWGEGIESRLETVDLRRVSNEPAVLHTLPYSEASGNGRAVQEIMLGKGRIGLTILRDGHAPWPIYLDGTSAHLQGKKGERYVLQYRNYSKQSIYEIVTTVDGLDVMSGRAGSIKNAGYVLKPGETLQVEGFRKSRQEVAAFRFSEVDDAYAANSNQGTASNAGVIGTAVFELYDPNKKAKQSPTDSPKAFPGDDKSGDDHRYASPPEYRKG
ncbi:hypothetical protein [Ralstonia sp. 24A2]|uniref:hypothetical protein n=1 Tax=Ralstonia sp. 24A2 TaxID=3447364 RepID=UPI003F6A34A2